MQTLKKITSVFIAILFLISSMGFTINKMVCLKSGKTKVAFTKFTDCCKKKKSAQPIVKANCCDINNTTFNLSDYNFTQKNNIPSSALIVASLNYNDTPTEFLRINSPLYSFSNLPPPLYGRELLSFISVLVI